MDKQFVYGIFSNDGDGTQLMFHLGVWIDQQKAYVYDNFPDSKGDIWVDSIKLNDI